MKHFFHPIPLGEKLLRERETLAEEHARLARAIARANRRLATVALEQGAIDAALLALGLAVGVDGPDYGAHNIPINQTGPLPSPPPPTPTPRSP